MTDAEIIDAMGGTAQVARICRVTSPSVSEWRRVGIPRARRQYLELLRPDIFSSECADELVARTTKTAKVA